jgi:hypothetical protein
VKTAVVFARWPEPGQVKTRLSPALPPALACDLHRAMLEDTLAAARDSSADRRVLCWADAPPDARPEALHAGEGFEWLHQGDGDLGARLERAFAAFLAPGDARVVVTGCDAPELDSDRVDAAFEALGGSDMVVGPARDGGYDLIGLSRPAPGLFRAVGWSTPRAGDDTRERARALGLSIASLDPLADVDTPADLVALIGRLLGEPGAAPRTAAALRRLGLLASPAPRART